MQPELFSATVPAHDPGGKVRSAMSAGMYGDAAFSPCQRYRHSLTRCWDATWTPPICLPAFALWIGMNPSTADASFNDRTVSREITYTRERLGLSAYVKCNVMDYRATYPEDLLRLELDECASPTNLPTIEGAASRAGIVIVAFGALHPRLTRHADDVMALLARLGVQAHCVGYTKEGFPRHPLYVRGDAPLVPYPRSTHA